MTLNGASLNGKDQVLSYCIDVMMFVIRAKIHRNCSFRRSTLDSLDLPPKIYKTIK